MHKIEVNRIVKESIAALIAVVLAILVAGCLGGPTPKGSVEGYVYGPDPSVPKGLGTKQESSSKLIVSRIGVVPMPGYVPIRGATVLIEGTGLSCTTNDEGYFRRDGIPIGTRYLRISHPNFRDALRVQVKIIANTVTSVGSQAMGKGYYLFIGINNYAYINPLTGCVADAQSMELALYKNSPFVGSATLLTDEAATKTGIQTAIANIGSKMNSTEDFFVIYFSGHGGNSGGKEFICPHDTTPDGGNIITDGELADWLKALPSQKITAIFDSCNSGAFINGIVTRGVRPRSSAPVQMRALKIAGYSVLTASKENESSWESGGHGLFTLYLAEGLDSTNRNLTDTNHDSTITVQELYDYAAPKTTEAAAQITDPYTGQPAQQHPQIWLGSNPPVLRY